MSTHQHDPDEFLKTPSGSDVFGYVDHSVASDIGYHNGPIKLQNGYPGEKGYGFLHVEGNDRRMKQINGFSFSNFCDYAHFVSSEYDWIGLGENGRLILVRNCDGYELSLIIQHRPKDGYWSIVTGIPRRVTRAEKLWERMRTGGSEPTPNVVEKRNRLETLTLTKKP